jgi:hypothetical protein
MQLDNGAPEANSDTVGDCRESPRAQDLIASYLPSTKDEAVRTVPTFDHAKNSALIGPRFVLFDLERGNDSTQAIGQ